MPVKTRVPEPLLTKAMAAPKVEFEITPATVAALAADNTLMVPVEFAFSVMFRVLGNDTIPAVVSRLSVPPDRRTGLAAAPRAAFELTCTAPGPLRFVKLVKPFVPVSVTVPGPKKVTPLAAEPVIAALMLLVPLV